MNFPIQISKEWEWEEPELWNLVKTATEFPKITVIISTYNRLEMLERAVKSILNQTYQNFNIIIVGDKCHVLDKFDIVDPRIFVHNLSKNANDGGATPKNVGLTFIKAGWICYLDDDNFYYRDHLLWHWFGIIKNPEATFGLSSIVMADDKPNAIKYNIVFHEPKLYRVDTSCIIHTKELIEKYGNWKTHKDGGYSHDWELVSRWLPHESWFVTKKCTVWYNLVGSKNNPKAIYDWYGDQQ